MGLRWKLAVTALFISLVQFRPEAGYAQFNYPNTELGNVLLRELDYLQGCPACRVYLGHVGLLGDWNGSDPQNPDNYDVYQQQSRTDTTNWVIKYLEATNNTLKRTSFTTFTTHNNIVYDGAPHHSYSGGWTPDGFFWHAAKFDISQRDQIVTTASSLVGINITFFSFPFTKLPVANMFIDTGSFRCDGIVEYIYEQAGVGSGRGLYPFYLEPVIASPSGYAVDGTVSETGRAPSMTIIDGNSNPVNNGGATNSNSITITGIEEANGSGVAQISLNSDVRTESGGLTATENFTGLADGQYTATVVDSAGNSTSNAFIIATEPPSAPTANDPEGNSLPSGSGTSFPSTRCVMGETPPTPAGYETVELIDSSGTVVNSQSFDCTETAEYGPYCNLSSGTYKLKATSCVDLSSFTTITITSASAKIEVCGDQSGCRSDLLGTGSLKGRVMRLTLKTLYTTGNPNDIRDRLMFDALGAPFYESGGGFIFVRLSTTTPTSTSYSVINSTSYAAWSDLRLHAEIVDSSGVVHGSTDADAVYAGWTYGQSTTFQVNVAQNGAEYVTSITSVTTTAPISYITIMQIIACSFLPKFFRDHLLPSGSCYDLSASDFVLTSTATLNVTFAPGGVNVDTATLQAFRFDGVEWSSAGVTTEGVSKDTTTSVITATAAYTRSGEYGFFFVGVDTIAPTTTAAFQGASFIFDGALFVSTDAFIVLSTTDALVNGYSVPVTSVTYRLDPLTPYDPFIIYTASVPLALGTHVLEYRSLDYFGNIEAIKTATFTVTAGTGFRNTSSQRIPGTLLNGFMGAGAEFEAVSRAENSLTLLISSANRQGVIAVDNIGEVGVGLRVPQANLDVGISTIGLQLRSGNSTATVSSAQIAFGYNGDSSYRHFMRTEHSTSTDGNKMDFLVWNPSAGSTATLASMSVLSLQGIKVASGGSLHVRPAGEPDAEVEVSNGSSTGGGTIQYGQLLTPSSRRFKTDIVRLTEQDDALALSEVAELRHVRFRYKSLQKDGRLADDARQPLRTGLIYEEVPRFLQGSDGTISSIERLVEVESALKAAMSRLERLQKRYAELKARRRP